MSSFNNINRPTISNRGGNLRLLMVNVKDVEDSTYRIVNGYVNTPIRMKEGIEWTEFFLAPNEIGGVEKPRRDLANSIFPYTLSFTVGRDTPEKIDQMMRMERNRFIVLVQNRNLEWVILGSPDEPATFGWTLRKTGRKGADKNHIAIEVSVSRRTPAPFYRVYASFYINDAGELMFDNTFDPTLSAEVNAAGELVITGPNEAKYSISDDGDLIYTP